MPPTSGKACHVSHLAASLEDGRPQPEPLSGTGLQAATDVAWSLFSVGFFSGQHGPC
jgi:hypothetical protein